MRTSAFPTDRREAEIQQHSKTGKYVKARGSSRPSGAWQPTTETGIEARGLSTQKDEHIRIFIRIDMRADQAERAWSSGRRKQNRRSSGHAAGSTLTARS